MKAIILEPKARGVPLPAVPRRDQSMRVVSIDTSRGHRFAPILLSYSSVVPPYVAVASGFWTVEKLVHDTADWAAPWRPAWREALIEACALVRQEADAVGVHCRNRVDNYLLLPVAGVRYAAFTWRRPVA